MARQIVVEIVGDARKFSGTLTDVTNQTQTFGGKLKNVGKGLAIGAGVASFNLLTNAISLGVSKLDDMHQAFLDDEASQTRLQVALKNSVTDLEAATKASEAYAAAQIDLGFADEDVRDSISQLVGQTKDYAKAIELVSLAQDLARAKNIDLAAATDVITKAYNGQARGLAALGVDVRGAAGGTQLLARAFQNVNGAAKAYAKTGSGAVEKANAKMGESMEKVGAAIDAVSQVVIPVMLTGLSALVDGGEAIAGAFGTAARVLNDEFGPALAIIGDIARNVASPLALLADVGANIIGAVGGNSGAGVGTGAVKDFGGGVKSINIGVPIHHAGGVVAGPAGSDQLIMAQAGERIIPANQSTGPNVIINIESFIGSDRDIDRFADRLAFRLRSTALS